MLLFYIYIASFVIGGVLLGASLFLGGHEADGDVAAEADVDAGADVDADAGADAGVDAHVDADADADAGTAGVEVSDLWLPFLSIRFWVFFLCFFGMTGLVLTLLALAGKWATLGSALGMGVACGFAAAFIIQRLKRAEVGLSVGAADFSGRDAVVILSVEPGSKGKVRVEIAGQTVDLIARTDSEATLGRGQRVLVIEVKDSEAVVEPLS